MDPLEEDILTHLEKLNDLEFQTFKVHLRHPEVLEGLAPIPHRPFRRESKKTMARLMARSYSRGEAQKIMVKILNNIHKSDLLERFTQTHQGRW